MKPALDAEAPVRRRAATEKRAKATDQRLEARDRAAAAQREAAEQRAVETTALHAAYAASHDGSTLEPSAAFNELLDALPAVQKLRVQRAHASGQFLWETKAFAGFFADCFATKTGNGLEGGRTKDSIGRLVPLAEHVSDNAEIYLPGYSSAEVDVFRDVWAILLEAKHIQDSYAPRGDASNFTNAMQARLRSIGTGEPRPDGYANGGGSGSITGRAVPPNHFAICSGWQRGNGGHAIMHVFIREHATAPFSLLTINTGQGVGKYHESSLRYIVGETPTGMKCRTAMRIDGVKEATITDAATLTFMGSMRAKGDDNHGPCGMYEVVLPGLVGSDLVSAMARSKELNPDKQGAWETPQRAGMCFFRCMLSTMKYLLKDFGLDVGKIKLATLAMRRSLIVATTSDLEDLAADAKKETAMWDTHRLLVNIGIGQTCHAAAKESKAGRLASVVLKQIKYECDTARAKLAMTGSLNKELEPPPPCPVEGGLETIIPRADPAPAVCMLENRLRDELIFASKDIAHKVRPGINIVGVTDKNKAPRDFTGLLAYLQNVHDVVVRLREEREPGRGVLEALSVLRIVFCDTMEASIPSGEDSPTLWGAAPSESMREGALVLLSTLIAHFSVAVASIGSNDRATRSSNIITGVVMWACFEVVLRSDPSDTDLRTTRGSESSAFRDLLNGKTRVDANSVLKQQAGFAFHMKISDRSGAVFTFDSLEVTGLLPCEAPCFVKARARVAHYFEKIEEQHPGGQLYSFYGNEPPDNDKKVSFRCNANSDPTVCFVDALQRAVQSGPYDPIASGDKSAFEACSVRWSEQCGSTAEPTAFPEDDALLAKYAMYKYAPGGSASGSGGAGGMRKVAFMATYGYTRYVDEVNSFTEEDFRMGWLGADRYRFPPCPIAVPLTPSEMHRMNDEPYFTNIEGGSSYPANENKATFVNKLAVLAPDHYMARDCLLLLKACVFEFTTKAAGKGGEDREYAPMVPPRSGADPYTTLDLAKHSKNTPLWIDIQSTKLDTPQAGGKVFSVAVSVLGKLCRFGENRVNEGPTQSPASLESSAFSLKSTLPPGHPARGKVSGNVPSVKKLNEVHVEDDVLHAFALPLFDGKLSSEDSEILLTSLTTPYIRIPLVLRFFATGNVSRLFNLQLRQLIHAVLFEPHQSNRGADSRSAITRIPVEPTVAGRALLGCDEGLLMKEMTHMPDAVVNALASLLAGALAIAGDEFESKSVEIVLYLLRLAVLVERFAIAAGASQDSPAMVALSTLLRSEGVGTLRSALKAWANAAEGAGAVDRKTPIVCIFKAHLAMLFASASFDFDDAEQQGRDITDALSALIYVTTYHEFGRETVVASGSMSSYDRDSLARALLRRPTEARCAAFDEERGKGSAAKVLTAAGKLSEYGTVVAACGDSSDEAAGSLLCGDALFLECVAAMRGRVVASMRSCSDEQKHHVLITVCRTVFRDPDFELGNVIREDSASPGVWHVRKEKGTPVHISVDIQTAVVSSGNGTTQAVPAAFVRNSCYDLVMDSTPHCSIITGGAGSAMRRIFIDTMGMELTLWSPAKPQEMVKLPGGVHILEESGTQLNKVEFEGVAYQNGYRFERVRHAEKGSKLKSLLDELTSKGKFIVLHTMIPSDGNCMRVAPIFSAFADEFPNVAFVKINADDDHCKIRANAELTPFRKIGWRVPYFECFQGGEVTEAFGGANEERLRELLTPHAGEEEVDEDDDYVGDDWAAATKMMTASGMKLPVSTKSGIFIPVGWQQQTFDAGEPRKLLVAPVDSTRYTPKMESVHPYKSDTKEIHEIRLLPTKAHVVKVLLVWDPRCATEKNNDPVVLWDSRAAAEAGVGKKLDAAKQLAGYVDSWTGVPVGESSSDGWRPTSEKIAKPEISDKEMRALSTENAWEVPDSLWRTVEKGSGEEEKFKPLFFTFSSDNSIEKWGYSAELIVVKAGGGVWHQLKHYDGTEALEETQEQEYLEVWSLVEHARRCYKVVNWTSDSRRCVADLGLHLPDPKALPPPPAIRFQAGNPAGAKVYDDGCSVDIIRGCNKLDLNERQRFVPPQCLQGVIPEALLKAQLFWTTADKARAALKRPDPLSPLEIELVKPFGKKMPVVTFPERYCTETVLYGEPRNPSQIKSPAVPLRYSCEVHITAERTEIIRIDAKSGAKWRLVNVGHGGESTPALPIRIASILKRVENIGWILCWAPLKEDSTAAIRADEILIELPRLELSFSIKLMAGEDAGGAARVHSNEYSGWFLHTEPEVYGEHANSRLAEILNGAPHSIVLSNVVGELKLLVPTCALYRPVMELAPWSSLIIPFRSAENKSGKPIASYDIHVSYDFMLQTTWENCVTWAYLQLMQRNYGMAMATIRQSMTDMPLSASERNAVWEFNQIGPFAAKDKGPDWHPDSVACNLNLLVTLGFSPDVDRCYLKMATSKKAKELYQMYIERLAHISAECRLTLEEEHTFAARWIPKEEEEHDTAASKEMAADGTKAGVTTGMLDARIEWVIAALTRDNDHSELPPPPTWVTGPDSISKSGGSTFEYAAQRVSAETSVMSAMSNVLNQTNLYLDLTLTGGKPWTCAGLIAAMWKEEVSGAKSKVGWLGLYLLASGQHEEIGAGGPNLASMLARQLYVKLSSQGKNEVNADDMNALGVIARIAAPDADELRASLPKLKDLMNAPLEGSTNALEFLKTGTSSKTDAQLDWEKKVKRAHDPPATAVPDQPPLLAEFLAEVVSVIDKFASTRTFAICEGDMQFREGATVEMPAFNPHADGSTQYDEARHHTMVTLNIKDGVRKQVVLRATADFDDETICFPKSCTALDAAIGKVSAAASSHSTKSKILSTLPFDIDAVSSSGGYIGTEMLSRFRGSVTALGDSHRASEKIGLNLLHDAGHFAEVPVSGQSLLKAALNGGASSLSDAEKGKLGGAATFDDVLEFWRASAIDELRELNVSIADLIAGQKRKMGAACETIENLVMSIDNLEGNTDEKLDAALRFELLRIKGTELSIVDDQLCAAMPSSQAYMDVTRANPFLSREVFRSVQELVLQKMLRVNFISQLQMVKNQVIKLLSKLVAPLRANTRTGAYNHDRINQIINASASVAGTICMKRAHAWREPKAEGIQDNLNLDPRFLAIEFINGWTMRGSQVDTIEQFSYGPEFAAMQGTDRSGLVTCGAVNDVSSCRQMIMGGGKTTVLCPLLALILADGDRLVVQAVPNALATAMRGVLWSCFVGPMAKPVFTMHFQRSSCSPTGKWACMAVHDASQLLTKLEFVRKARGVLVSTPTSIKSLMLKVLAGMHSWKTGIADLARRGPDKDDDPSGATTQLDALMKTSMSAKVVDKNERATKVVDTARVANILAKAVGLFGRQERGVLLLDEVDMLLHPLKSELNFPVGPKVVMDLGICGETNGERWTLAIFMLGVVFKASEGLGASPHSSSSSGKGGGSSATKEDTLFESLSPRKPSGGAGSGDGTVDPLVAGFVPQVKAVLEAGLLEYKIQNSPHVVLLDKAWYHQALAPVMTDVLIVWFRDHGLFGEDGGVDEHLCKRGEPLDVELVKEYSLRGPFRCSDAVKRHLESNATPLAMKLLNLGYGWISVYLPHAMSKINRVTYGLLTQTELDEGKHNGLASRKYCAVPFMGKDVPSPAAEFAHPDIIIGLTVAAYLHEGMRLENVSETTRMMKDELTKESGTLATRPQFVLFESYIKRPFEIIIAEYARRSGAHTSIDGGGLGGGSAPVRPLALDVFQESEPRQIKGLFKLWKHSSQVIFAFLQKVVFPSVQASQGVKMSASGQELGSSMIFGTRCGFSGTPSDLLPREGVTSKEVEAHPELSGTDIAGAAHDREIFPCAFESGSDGRMLQTLSDPAITTVLELGSDWGVVKLLRMVATNSFHALIDSGALVTGFDNEEVARFLLDNGLADMKGCVYLDSRDEQVRVSCHTRSL